MKRTLATIILTTSLTLFSQGVFANTTNSTQPIHNLESTVSILSESQAEEKISDEQHQKELRAMVNFYIARGAEHWQGKYVSANGTLAVIQMVFDDEKLKESLFITDSFDEWRELYKKKRYESGTEMSDREIQKKIDEIREGVEKKGYTFGASTLTPLDYTAIKYDLENNVFYLKREFRGQEMFYAYDINTDGMQLYTKDFVRTNKDLEMPGHKFEGPEICNKENEWKQESKELTDRFKEEVHFVYEIAAKRYAGTYGFPKR